jgi:hypothetical protein
MTQHIITVTRLQDELDDDPQVERTPRIVTEFRMHFNGQVIMSIETGDKADRIAAGQRAQHLGFMVCFGD